MSWLDRLKEAAYTSPGGTRQRFSYGDVEQSVEKRTAAFEFSGIDGAYVQDNGHGARRFPLLCVFSGPDCDREAEGFTDLLLERGPGVLEHPLYGRKPVVPFGTITRRDDLRTAANQAIIDVVFWSTLGAVYPSSDVSPKHEVQISVGLTQGALATTFEKRMQLNTVARKANARLTVDQALRNVQGALRSVAAVNEASNREFRDLQQQINFGLDVLIGQPLQLAQQSLALISAPSRALAGVLDRLNGYADLLSRMIDSSENSPGDSSVLPGLQLRLSNDFYVADLYAGGAVTGSVESVANNTFTTKPQALEAAEAILQQMDDFTAWRDERFEAIGDIDTGESYQALQETVALAVGFLVEISFSLVPEHAVVLDRPRGLLELTAELYGSVADERINFMISSNNLTGSEILELPRGRKVLFYA